MQEIGTTQMVEPWVWGRFDDLWSPLIWIDGTQVFRRKSGHFLRTYLVRPLCQAAQSDLHSGLLPLRPTESGPLRVLPTRRVMSSKSFMQGAVLMLHHKGARVSGSSSKDLAVGSTHTTRQSKSSVTGFL